MEEKKQVSLPENAQRELRPGEEYKPLLDPRGTFKEVTPYSVTIGVLMAVLFSAAAAYLGLKVGQVFEAAIPIAIIAVGLTGMLGKKDGLSQNVIIQSIGGCSGKGDLFAKEGILKCSPSSTSWRRSSTVSL